MICRLIQKLSSPIIIAVTGVLKCDMVSTRDETARDQAFNQPRPISEPHRLYHEIE